MTFCNGNVIMTFCNGNVIMTFCDGKMAFENYIFFLAQKMCHTKKVTVPTKIMY